MKTIRNTLNRIKEDKLAVAMTEFALATPFMLTLGLWGLETANFAVTSMRVSQVSMHLADNASRIGEVSSLTKRKIYEDDINDFFLGSNYQAGEAIDLYEFGRVVISSLQVEPGTAAQQYIAWQRCKGRRNFQSEYGAQDTGKGDPSFRGMGPNGQEVFAIKGEAVMFVEVSYEYQPIVTDAFLSTREITSQSSFTVRSNRDLSQIYQRDPSDPAEIARCDIYDAYKETPEPRRASGGWGWVFSDNPNAPGNTGGSSGGTSSGSGGSSGGATSSGGASSGGNGGSSGGNNSGSSGGNNNGSSSGGGSNGNGNDNRWCPSWNWWCDESGGGGGDGGERSNVLGFALVEYGVAIK